MNTKKHTYTAIDLFCGAGGLTCGLKQAGFHVLSAVEIDKLAAESYSKNHPEVRLFESDISVLPPEVVMGDLKIKSGELDLLAGCPPCQGFSSLRTKKKSISVNDERNDLIYEFLHWVKVFYPKCILLENVPALALDQRIQDISDSLRKLGYFFDKNSLRIENISDYGVPQRRKRMILMVSRFGEIERHPKSTKLKTVRDTISHLKKPGESGDILHDLPEKRTQKIIDLIRHIPKDGGGRLDLPPEYWLECHKRYPKGFYDIYGRMAWDNVSPTITGGCHNPSKGRFLHPEEDRAITLREAALLQTFPMNYYFSLSKGKEKAALLIGNAIPPNFVYQQGKAIRKHIKLYEK